MRHIRRGKNITKHSTVYGCILSVITYLPCASLSAALARLRANDEVDVVFFLLLFLVGRHRAILALLALCQNITNSKDRKKSGTYSFSA